LSSDSIPASDRALQAALTEFTAIRSLMATRLQMQVALMGAGLTGIGVIVGLALQHKGDLNLLLLVPVVASVVATGHSELRSRIGLHGRYLNEVLWPYVQKISDVELPSWEGYWGTHADRIVVAVGGMQAPGFFLLSSVLALIARVDVLGQHNDFTGLWCIGALMACGSAIYVINDARSLIRRLNR
jgi:hypothetical protein